MTVKISKKALSYLRLIGRSEECCVTLTKGYTKQAHELKGLGFAGYIPLRQGGVQVGLTRAGIDYLESLGEPSQS